MVNSFDLVKPNLDSSLTVLLTGLITATGCENLSNEEMIYTSNFDLLKITMAP